MFYGLAKKEKEFIAENLNKFGAIAPCTIDVNEGTEFYYEGLFQFPSLGIKAYGGPNWDHDLALICSQFDQEQCDYATNAGSGEPYSMKNEIHWAQNTVVNRFQEYDMEFIDGARWSTLIDIKNISEVEVGMWAGDMDTNCSLAQAQITRQQIGENVTLFETI